MKRLLFLLAVTMIFACRQERQAEIVIRGQIENPSDSIVEIFYYRNYITYATETAGVQLDQTNRFEVRIPLQQPRLVHLRMRGVNLDLYLGPGAGVNVVMDAANPRAIPRVTGAMAEESRFLVHYAAEMESRYSPMMILHQLQDMDPVDVTQYMQEVYYKKLDYLQQYEGYRELDPAFVALMHSRFLYEKYSLLLEYPAAYASMHPRGEEPVLPAGYYDFLMDPELISDEHLQSREYISFIRTYLGHYHEQYAQADDARSGFEIRYDMIGDLLGGRSHDLMLSQVVVSMLNYGDPDIARQMFSDYVTRVPDPHYQEVVAEEYHRVMALSPGNPAPGFSLRDIEGQQVSLDDFRGKVVYLSFWASWCSICMAQMPHAAELKQRLDHEDLVFLYISVDFDQEVWQQTVYENQIEGVHLYAAGFGHEVPAAYNLREVPKYMIIGRDGNIFSQQPPRPDDPAIDQALMQALE